MQNKDSIENAFLTLKSQSAMDAILPPSSFKDRIMKSYKLQQQSKRRPLLRMAALCIGLIAISSAFAYGATRMGLFRMVVIMDAQGKVHDEFGTEVGTQTIQDDGSYITVIQSDSNPRYMVVFESDTVPGIAPGVAFEISVSETEIGIAGTEMSMKALDD